ncbi:MAG: DnaJ domain-containing protein [Candidatus Helarchaeota archaeon]|nr:DnaJ domain-containing protein [Candidatus Helarchaeota archaeon]
MTKDFDLYDILGVNSNASADEIRSSYRRLARKFHPDINPNKDAEERIKLINIAYGVLSDPVKRQQYDFMRRYGVSNNVYSANYGETVEFKSLSEFFEFLSKIDDEEFEKILDSLFSQLFLNFIKGLWEMGDRFRKRIRQTIQNTVKNFEKTVRNFFDLFGGRRS